MRFLEVKEPEAKDYVDVSAKPKKVLKVDKLEEEFVLHDKEEIKGQLVKDFTVNSEFLKNIFSETKSESEEKSSNKEVKLLKEKELNKAKEQLFKKNKSVQPEEKPATARSKEDEQDKISDDEVKEVKLGLEHVKEVKKSLNSLGTSFQVEDKSSLRPASFLSKSAVKTRPFRESRKMDFSGLRLNQSNRKERISGVMNRSFNKSNYD